MGTSLAIILAAFAIALWTFTQEAKGGKSTTRPVLQPVQVDEDKQVQRKQTQ